MDEPAKIINRTPIEWVPELPGDIDRSIPRYDHSPLCQCETCRLKESLRFGSNDNPLVLKAAEPPRS